MLLSVLKNVDRTDIFTDCGYYRGKPEDRFQGFYRVLWKPGMRHTKAAHASLDGFYCRGYQDISPNVCYPDILRPFSETVQLSLADQF